jgi:Domain of unknown function (DUF4917)
VARTITDELEAWRDVERSLPDKDRGLLIGNGASIALWPQFRYRSLYEMAKDASKPDHLTDREIGVFNALETQNFELVLSAMITAGKIWGVFGKPSKDINDLRASYSCVRKSLIRAVKAVHVPFDSVTEELKTHLREEFAKYSYVYSTNYDLLLYWSMMNDRERFKDFVWGRDNDSHHNIFDVSDTDLWDEKKPTTKILFLHGALHFYKNNEGRTFKKLSGEGGNLLDLFDVQGDAIPLFISEGTSRDKLSAITRNDYLSFAYQRFSKHRGSLVVFGHSLTPEFDQHLIDAIRKWKRYDQQRKSFQAVPRRRIVALSIRSGDDPHSIIELKSRLTNVFSDYEVRFFDSRTHPLGQERLQITAAV